MKSIALMALLAISVTTASAEDTYEQSEQYQVIKQANESLRRIKEGK